MKPKFIGKVKLTKQGQLTLPQEARNNRGIEVETELFWYEFKDFLILTKELENPKDLIKKIRKK